MPRDKFRMFLSRNRNCSSRRRPCSAQLPALLRCHCTGLEPLVRPMKMSPPPQNFPAFPESPSLLHITLPLWRSLYIREGPSFLLSATMSDAELRCGVALRARDGLHINRSELFNSHGDSSNEPSSLRLALAGGSEVLPFILSFIQIRLILDTRGPRGLHFQSIH